MTTPIQTDTPPDDALDQSSRLALAGQLVGTDRPQLASMLAQSSVPASDMQTIGSFVQSLSLATANRLAQEAGAQTNFTPSEVDALKSINEPVDQQQQQVTPNKGRNWLESAVEAIGTGISNTGHLLFHNPVTNFIGKAFDVVGNIAHMPWRLGSMAIGGVDDQTMRSMGYDPSNPLSDVAFAWTHPTSDFHDLSDARKQYGDDLVNLAVAQMANPDQFQKNLESGIILGPDGQPTKVDMTTPDGQAAVKAFTDRINSPEAQAAFKVVDAQHISPGRDLAGVLVSPFGAKSEDNAAFRLLSGALDAAYDWYTDPLLNASKINTLIKTADVLARPGAETGFMARAANGLAQQVPGFAIQTDAAGVRRLTVVQRSLGLRGAADQEGVAAALATNPDGTAATQAGAYAKSFLDDNNQLRQLTATVNDSALSAEERQAADVQRGQLYAAMTQKYQRGGLMGLQDEVNGTRVLPDTQVKWNEDGGLDVQATAQAAGVKPGDVLPLTTDTLAGTGAKGVVTGARVITGQPIENLDDFRDYMVSTNGLLRLTGGVAAQPVTVMPGRLSLTGTIRAQLPGLAAKVWDYTKPGALLPNDAEQPILDAIAANPDADPKAIARAFAAKGDAQYDALHPGADASNPATATLANLSPIQAAKAARAKAEQLGRRITSMQPLGASAANGDGIVIDLTDPNSVTNVQRFAQLYLARGDVARLTAAYSQGDLSTRRTILKGILEQTMHAAGLYRSDGGTAFADRFLRDQDALLQQKYGLEDTSVLQRSGSDEPAQAALYPSQLSTKVVVPTFKALHYNAGKFAVDGFAARAGLATFRAGAESNRMDALMHAVKLGWIATAAGGARNALEEMLTVVGKGLGPTWLTGRKLYTDVTADIRAQNRQYARDYRSMVDDYGDAGLAQDQLAKQSGAAISSYQDAQKELATAQAQLAAEQGKDLLSRSQDRIDAALARVDAATAALGPAKAEAEKAAGLENAIRHRIPQALRGATDYVNDKAVSAIAGRFLSLTGRLPDEQEYRWAAELTDHELTSVLREGAFQHQVANDVIAQDTGAPALNRAGLMARPYGFELQGDYQGFQQVEVDGGQGIDSWAKWMGLRFDDPNSPAHAFVQTLRDTNDLNAAERAVREALDAPELAYFRRNAEHANTLDDGSVARTPEDKSLALDQLANRISADLLLGLSRRGLPTTAEAIAAAPPEQFAELVRAIQGNETQLGGINTDLLNRLADAQEQGAPDRSWLALNVPESERPQHTIGQLWAPYNPAHAPGTMPNGYTQMLTVAYRKLVADQINAVTRNPLFTGLYVNARRNLGEYEQALIDAGWSEDKAAEVAKNIALSHSQQELFKHVDNPYVGTQMSTIVRNFWAFERFQEDYLRRWGRALRDNPELVRKLSLLVHGGQATGMVQHDDQGNLTMIYPGSSLAIGVANKLLSAVGANVQIPIHGDLTTELRFVNASLENPFGFASTPLVSLPLDVMTGLMGADHPILFASLQKAANGELGQGKTWYEKMLPSWANRIASGVLGQDPGSSFGQSFMQAMFNMEAAGQLAPLERHRNADGSVTIDPAQMADIQNKLSVAVRNGLVWNTLFGFFAPMAPALEMGADAAPGSQGQTPDWSAHIAGLNSLRSEFRKAAADIGYQAALTWWQAAHPNELIYDGAGAGSRTKVQTTKASIPASMTAAAWMQDNKAFVDKYRNIASYFLPSGDPNTPEGQYSDIAYRAQLEAGMRQYVPLDQVWQNIVVQRGQQMYDATMSDVNQRIQDALANGRRSEASQYEQIASKLKGDIYKYNPLFANYKEQQAAGTGTVQEGINSLRNLLQDNTPEIVQALGPNRPGIAALLQAYDTYEAQAQRYAGMAGPSATAARRVLQRAYDAQVQAIVGTSPQAKNPVTGVFPELQDLARGLFTSASTT